MGLQFPTGDGSFDTHKAASKNGRSNPNAGQPYKAINYKDIVNMVKRPPSVDKKFGKWFIPTTYLECDARSHDVQRQSGVFRWLTLDVDHNNLSLNEIDAALSKVIGNSRRIIYSTRSATAENRKWRALIPLVKECEVSGADFADTQNAFYNLLESSSYGTLIPDRALARPAQLVYLPNKGDFYEWQARPAKTLNLAVDRAIIDHRDGLRVLKAQAEATALQARDERMAKRRQRAQAGDVSPLDHFNASNCIADLLERYDYQQDGSSIDWQSSMQSSGSYATRNYGDYWVSLSGSDAAAGIGQAKDQYCWGDAFDLFCHFEHGGDMKKAVRAYAVEAGLNRKRERPAPNTSQQDVDPRSFAEVLAEAEALNVDNIEEIERIVAETVALNPLRKDQVFRAIKAATGIPLTTLRNQEKGDPEAAPDHLELANLTLSGIGVENIICAEAFTWRWSSTGVWQAREDRAIKQDVQNCLESEAGIGVTSHLVSAVTDVLKTEIFKPDHEFNIGNPEAVNCLNGELHLHNTEGWHLEPHCREHYRTTQIPVAYDPEAVAPMFSTFLDEVFSVDTDHEDKVRSVLELMGYTLMSHARHEKFIMLIGSGANGKSVLLAVLEGLLGNANVAGVQPANFDRGFQRAHLHMKLANIVTELKQGEVIADAELKAITSGEPSTVEHKFKNPFVMRPYATCWFGTNHMPHTRDFSDALFRRAAILPFNRTFDTWEQDPQLKDRLLSELPGILNLALSAYQAAMSKGFTDPSSSEVAKKEWRLEADQVAQFVEDACQKQPAGRVTFAAVNYAYTEWAIENGIRKTMGKKGLRERLTRLGFGEHRDGKARYVTGLRVLPWNEL